MEANKDMILLTFIKEKTEGIDSVGVLPYTMKNGKPDKPIADVIACIVDSEAEHFTRMTLTVHIKEESSELRKI